MCAMRGRFARFPRGQQPFSLHGGGGWGRVSITRMHYLPNILTLSRIALVVVFTVALALDGAQPGLCNEAGGAWFSPLGAGACVALWAFVVGAITDFFDGHLARKWGVVTDFGKLIDPLADKILVGAAFVYLSSAGVCPFWITILIIFREFLVTGLRQLAAARGHIMAADWCGKWKTGFQLAYCIACMMHLAYGGNLPEPLCSLSVGAGGEWTRGILLAGAVLLTLWSGVNYCIQARKFI